MEVKTPSTGSAAPAPKPEPGKAPANEPRKPLDNSAARQYPNETKAAMGNAYGKVPQDGNAKQADNAPKAGDAGGKTSQPLVVTTPTGSENGSKTNILAAENRHESHPPVGAKTPAGESKTPADEAKAPADPKTTAVNADARTSPGEPGVPVTDANGSPVKAPDNRAVVYDKFGNPIPVESDGRPVTDPNGNPYAVDKTGKYVETVDGKFVVYDPRGNQVVTGPDGKYVSDENGNALAIGKNGNYLPNTVYDKNTGLRTAVDAGGKIVRNADGKPLAVDDTGKIIQDANGTRAVYNSKGAPVFPAGKNASGLETFKNAKTGELESSRPGGPVYKIDPMTNDIARDAYGNPLAIDDNGKPIQTPDGKQVVYDSNDNLTFVDPATGKIATDGSGNPLAVTPDGQYAQTEDGNVVVHDKANGDNMIAIDNKTGDAIIDGKGNPIALDENGKYLKTPNGNTVVYARINDKSHRVSTDKNGDFYSLNGKPLAIGEDGAPLRTPDGNYAIYDKRGNMIPVDKDGKAVTDQSGNTYALTRDGNYVPGAVYDKASGFTVKPDANHRFGKNSEGMFPALDDSGNVIRNANGDTGYLDAKGALVFGDGQGKRGIPLYKDAKTGELETQTASGAIYKVDPSTRDYARDANGTILPAAYNPIDNDPTRPPVRPNENPETTLKNLPHGSERGDPMQIKNELFDEYRNLDVDKLVAAAGKYDPRDIYDALINAGESGGWDNLRPTLPKGARVAHLDEAQSREVLAALVAWQNENGKYHPLKPGAIPPVVLGTGGPAGWGGFAYGNNIYIGLDNVVGSIATSLFHELNHHMSSDAFKETYKRQVDGVLVHDEVITETLSNNWTGDTFDTGYEKRTLTPGFKVLHDAVMKMGGGDRNKGLDILKRAYFAGDADALQQLKASFPPDADILSNIYAEGPPDIQLG